MSGTLIEIVKRAEETQTTPMEGQTHRVANFGAVLAAGPPPASTSPMASSTPPEWELHSPPTAAHFRRLYDKHQLVLIRGALSPSSADGWWAEPEVQLRKAFDAAPKMVAGTWTCENGTKRDAVEVLGRPAPRKRRRSEATTFAEDERWYASFVVQPSGGSAQLAAFLATMPLAELPACFASSRAARGDAVAHANAVWVFFGRVAGREPLAGRPEHTDAVEQAGTLQKWGRLTYKPRAKARAPAEARVVPHYARPPCVCATPARAGTMARGTCSAPAARCGMCAPPTRWWPSGEAAAAAIVAAAAARGGGDVAAVAAATGTTTAAVLWALG